MAKSAINPFSSKHLAAYAAQVADLIDEYGTALMPIFKRLMREYKSAKEDEEDLALALHWHRNGYQIEDKETAPKICDDSPLRLTGKLKHVVPLKDRLSLSPEDASLLTGIGLTSIKMATYSGALVARKHGRNTVILPEDLKAWLAALPRIDKNTDSDRA